MEELDWEGSTQQQKDTFFIYFFKYQYFVSQKKIHILEKKEFSKQKCLLHCFLLCALFETDHTLQAACY